MTELQIGKRVRGEGSRLVYDTLRHEILTLELAPGVPLDEQGLAERFAMSRSPIREALIRLAGEGLVVILSNRSTLVAPFDVTSFPRYIEALDLVQRACTRFAAERRTKSDISNLRARQKDFVAAVKSNDHLRMSATNRDFHVSIAEAGRNPYMTGQYRRLLDEGRRILHLHFDYLAQSPKEDLLTDEHDDLIKAIEDRDADRADHLAHEHTRQFRDRFVDFVHQNLGQDMNIVP